MMAGSNPSWRSNIHPPPPPPQPLFPSTQCVSHVGSNSSSLSLDLLPSSDHQHQPIHTQHPSPQYSSWSQLLLSGSTTGMLLSGNNEDRLGNIIDPTQFQPNKKLGNNWEDQLMILGLMNPHDHVKQEVSSTKSNSYGQEDDHEEEEEVQANRSANCASWSKVLQVSSPRSCVTSFGNNNNNNNNNTMLDFSYNNHKEDFRKNQNSDQHSLECNSTTTVVVCKKPRVQSSSSQPPLKVRKEKLGDRITSLHQLVSPFGKTDTASVLSEAIGYIRFLQSQIEALSCPYLGQASKHSRNTNKQYVDVEGGEKQKQKDLRSRGLCLVPVSCTYHVGSDSGADYWAPSNYANSF